MWRAGGGRADELNSFRYNYMPAWPRKKFFIGLGQNGRLERRLSIDTGARSINDFRPLSFWSPWSRRRPSSFPMMSDSLRIPAVPLGSVDGSLVAGRHWYSVGRTDGPRRFCALFHLFNTILAIRQRSYRDTGQGRVNGLINKVSNKGW